MNTLLAIALAIGTLTAVAPPTPADAVPVPVVARHSRPGASISVYLDFDGHVTTGTRWNRRYTDGAPIVTTAFAEQAWTDAVWEGVAEDFSPFRPRRHHGGPGRRGTEVQRPA